MTAKKTSRGKRTSSRGSMVRPPRPKSLPITPRPKKLKPKRPKRVPIQPRPKRLHPKRPKQVPIQPRPKKLKPKRPKQVPIQPRPKHPDTSGVRPKKEPKRKPPYYTKPNLTGKHPRPKRPHN